MWMTVHVKDIKKDFALPNASEQVFLLAFQHKLTITWWKSPVLTWNTGYGEKTLQFLVTHTNFNLLESPERTVSCGRTLQVAHVSLAARSVALCSLWPPLQRITIARWNFVRIRVITPVQQNAECLLYTRRPYCSIHPTIPLRELETSCLEGGLRWL